LSNIAKIAIIILSFSLITSCNSVKRLSDNQYLLTENKVIVNDKKTSNLDVLSYINQRPNQKVLGMPFALYVHNWAKPNFEKSTDKWSINHPNTTKFISSVFSEKQVKEVYLFSKKMNKILKSNGELPVIINQKKTKKSVNTLKRYYFDKGFFDAEVTSKEIETGTKRKSIEYSVTTNKPYLINKFTTDIKSPALQKIYNANKDKSFIKEGKQYDRDNLVKEQIRLTNLFRNEGVYYFGKNYIRFEAIEKDSISKNRDIKLIIKDRIIKKGEDIYTEPFKIQKVTKINVYTHYSFLEKDKLYRDSVKFNGYTFFAHKKLRFNAKRLANNISITPNGVYKDDELKQTIQYLNDINIFRTPINILYTENSDGDLIANINLVPLKRFGVDTQAEVTHSNIKPFGVLAKLGLISRNVFRGSEIFKFSVQGSFLNVAEDVADPDFDVFGLTAWEVGANISLKIPRILFPINTRSFIPKHMRPTTNIGISTSFQKNIGLDRLNFSGNITYNWKKSNKVKHQLELINVQYINNINSLNYFSVFNSEFIKLSKVAQTITDSNSVNSNGEITNTAAYINYVLNPINNFSTTDFDNYKTVQRVKERKNIITEDILVPAMSYSYIYNGKRGLKDNKFSFFRARVVSSGSITSLLTAESYNGKKELFGLPIAQYVKTELEYKKYWRISNQNHLVFRTFIGAAVPFGNSTEIPFSRSYRAGGSNDIRAWKTFELGPGSSVSNLDFNIGNLKFISNLEYRFNIINSFYSAIFIDVGNVWDLTNSDLTNKTSKFKGFNSVEELAIGSGLGLRYDFGFLIFRTDFGFKTYEPYLPKNKRWFRNYNFSNTVFNFGINYPF